MSPDLNFFLDYCDILFFLDTNLPEYSSNMNAQQQLEFVKKVEQHQGIINNLCRLYYSNLEDQKDTRQDIILQLWKSYPKYRGESQLSTWIYSVSLKTILAKIRKQNRRISTDTFEQVGAVQLPAVMGMDDDIQLLNSIIKSLQGEDKAMVILFLEGYHNKEIAELLGISASNVSTRLHRIKNKLKDQYQKLNHVFR